MNEQMQKVWKNFYGEKYKEVIRKKSITEGELKKSFLKKYPSAQVSMFHFLVTFNQDGSVNSKTVTFQDPKDDISSYNITSAVFTKNPEYTQYLYWPKGWNLGGKVPEFKLNVDEEPFTNNLLVYINEKDKFSILLEPFDTSYSGEPSNDVRTEKFDYLGNPYFTAIAASYVSSYLCGISEEHFTNKVLRAKSHFLTSISRYHYTFHLRRFMKNPKKLSRYMTGDVIKILQKNIPVAEKWKTVYDPSSARLDIFKKKLKESGKTVRNVKLVPHGNMGASTSYEELIWGHGGSKNDYKLFIQKKTTGLTKIGEKLFQLSLQSFVYSVLGAQAKSRWGIFGQGAKSLQTQEIFKGLMEDTIVQDDITVSISNMRQAVKSTNVVLNYAISPGLILIPSDLIILKNSVTGYNNVFTLTTDTMSFGHNKDLNQNLHLQLKNPEYHPQLEYPDPQLVQENSSLPVVAFVGSLVLVFIVKKAYARYNRL